MSELADALMNEGDSGVNSSAEIPSGAAPEGNEAASSANSPPEKPLSLRDQINKSVESVRTEEAKRVRDAATGKFTRTDAKPEASAAEKPAAAEIQPTEKDAQPSGSKPVGPPPGWSAESKAFFNSLPADHPIRRDVAKREDEVSTGFKAYSEKAKQYEAIDQVIAPVRQTFQQAGIQSDADAIKALLGWEAGFRNPATRSQAFVGLARQYGFDLSTLAQNPSPAPSAGQEIPEPLRPVIDQFGNIVQDVNGLKQEFQTLRSERIETELRTFAKDKPHFDKVRGLMGHLMTPPKDHNGNVTGPAPALDLESAYQQATKIHPEVSAQIKADDDAKRTAELAKTNAEKAARARAASVSPSPRSPNGSPANGTQKPKSNSVRESLLSSIGELREGQRA